MGRERDMPGESEGRNGTGTSGYVERRDATCMQGGKPWMPLKH
jgi:hypothetical protein